MSLPKPPSPQNAQKRFDFFMKNKSKFSPDIIQKEMQRYAYTPHGRKIITAMMAQQKQQQALQKTGLI